MESDETLYRRVREGDMAAFDALYDRYQDRLFGFLLRTLRSREDAEDVFHDAFLSALRSPEVSFDTGSFRSWLFRIARNRCKNRHRSEQRGARALGVIDAIGPTEAAPSAESELQERQLLSALDGAVGRLPPALSEIYHLRSSGLSYEEMADVLAIPLGTLKSRMNQMVSILREEVKPWTA
jgi:RNA polymerase sigma-70 factor (ECF subfamily)